MVTYRVNIIVYVIFAHIYAALYTNTYYCNILYGAKQTASIIWLLILNELLN